MLEPMAPSPTKPARILACAPGADDAPRAAGPAAKRHYRAKAWGHEITAAEGGEDNFGQLERTARRTRPLLRARQCLRLRCRLRLRNRLRLGDRRRLDRLVGVELRHAA